MRYSILVFTWIDSWF